MSGIDRRRDEVEQLREALAASEGERDDLDTAAGTLLGENVELQAEVQRLREGIERLADAWNGQAREGGNALSYRCAQDDCARDLRALLEGGDQ